MREIDIEETALALERGGVVVDVREPCEYAAGHVPGVVLIPMGQLFDRLGEIDRGAPVLIICATGNRSAAASELLNHAGYETFSVVGGTTAWARSGRPIEGN